MNQILNPQSAEWKAIKIPGFSYHQILNETNGKLKFLRIEPGAHYPAHIHPDKIEYAVVIEGSPTITLGDDIYSAKQGDVFVFPKGVNHALGNSSDQVAVLLTGAIKVEESTPE